MHDPFVSVIIPVYNDPDGLARCLAALREQTCPANAFEIIVADNVSDPPADPIASAAGAVVVHESHPTSYAARNAGARAARGSIFAFTDADCIPARDWIAAGVAALTSSGASLAGGRINVVARHVPRSAVEAYECVMAFPQRRYVEAENFAATANAFVTKAAFDAAGGFRPDLASDGDRDFGWRLAAAGHRLVYAEEAVITHPPRETWRALRMKILRLIGGDFDRTGSRFSGIGRRLVPPVRSAGRILTSKTLTRREAAGATRILFAVYALRVAETFRIAITGRHRPRTR